MTSFKVRLQNISCQYTSEHDGDEIFIRYRNKKIWPMNRFKKMRLDTVHPINVEIADLSPESIIEIEVWEADTFSSDCLGVFRLKVDGPGRTFIADLQKHLNKNYFNYRLMWNVDVQNKSQN